MKQEDCFFCTKYYSTDRLYSFVYEIGIKRANRLEIEQKDKIHEAIQISIDEIQSMFDYDFKSGIHFP